MPKYDFRCISCNIVHELLVPIEESHINPPCTLCGSDTNKVFTPPAVHFSGPGFYKTDNK